MHRNAPAVLGPGFAPSYHRPFLRYFAPVEGEGGGAFTPINSQAELDAVIASRLSRERAKYAHFDGVDLADLQAKAQELESLKSSQGVTEEDLRSKLTAAEARAQAAEANLATANTAVSDSTSRLTRYEVAAEAGIPLTHAPRLIGASKEELLADANEYKKSLRTGGYDPGQGRADGGVAEGAAGIAEAEKRFGKTNQ